MRIGTFPLVSFFALILSVSAFAQEPDVKTGGKGREETVKLSINGGWDVGWVHVGRDLAQIGNSTGLGVGSAKTQDLIVGRVYVTAEATIQDNVKVRVTIDQPHYVEQGNGKWGPGFVVDWNPLNGYFFGGPLLNTLRLDEAFVSAEGVFAEEISLAFGIQNVAFDVRGDGNPLFLALGRSDDPWISLDDHGHWDGTARGEFQFAGILGTYAREGFTLRLGAFQTTRFLNTGADFRQQEDRVLFIDVMFDVKERARIGLIAAMLSGSGMNGLGGTGKDDVVFTYGAAANVEITPRLSVFGDVYVQTGDVRNAPPAIDAGGLAWRVGAAITFDAPVKPWIEVQFISISGSDSTDATEEEAFISYENNDDMLFFDSNEWGMDFDKNIQQIKVKGGITLQSGISLLLKAAMAEPEEDADIPIGDDWGTEIDGTVEYAFNKNAKVYLTVAFLTGMDIFEDGIGTAEDGGVMYLLGTTARF